MVRRGRRRRLREARADPVAPQVRVRRLARLREPHRRAGSLARTGGDRPTTSSRPSTRDARRRCVRSTTGSIAEVSAFGPDVEVAPKKTSVSLRRHKQFALIEAPSATRLQLGREPARRRPDRTAARGGRDVHAPGRRRIGGRDRRRARRMARTRRTRRRERLSPPTIGRLFEGDEARGPRGPNSDAPGGSTPRASSR